MLQQYKRILVAIDGSYEAELAFRKAVEVAKRNHAHLFLLHVIDTRAFQNVSSFDSAMVEQVTDTQKQTMKEYVSIAKRSGLDDVSYEIEYGAPKTLIGRDYPQAHDIDLIMIGATGLNAVERLLIGSVTEYITRVANCDVLVVRTDLDNKPALIDDKHPESHIQPENDK
ncbi:universal stress protein [Schleiferilactobacillus perolens]|jgi:nucleotide-binding universal stress UspA family protein|uniref:Universal stress protein UspA family protein n=1 Tax=Schleiferilactobacillus perolens DSM 12744 TaxID=1423792 RepID=A0A0R1N8Q9_9LACO|nr:universal stress protein [Schleiferilactobacillus perolens]KRL14245.1 universal stress protein UspA family protein [Schleiferilactobacillus perolens DSM 12744]MCI1892835.1 universal stress protein [Schleiferilactobacillus harbinensis]MCI1913136.1 universal stress protein [Schleiferilactobacillus harbinensis]MCI2171991.1 universal stress protein [Schleiferilactobacillus perolens]